ncbi:8579_t:CDS:1, partial [Scutellospora calospora]
QPEDRGRDIIGEICGLTFVVQCKAWYHQKIDKIIIILVRDQDETGPT